MWKPKLTKAILIGQTLKIIPTTKESPTPTEHTLPQNLIPIEVITIQEEVLQEVVETAEVLDLLAQTIEV